MKSKENGPGKRRGELGESKAAEFRTLSGGRIVYLCYLLLVCDISSLVFLLSGLFYRLELGLSSGGSLLFCSLRADFFKLC